jgi:hypothetical protein
MTFGTMPVLHNEFQEVECMFVIIKQQSEREEPITAGPSFS